MSAPRIIPAGPMPADAILPLIREVGGLRERGEYGIAAELEERIRQPITVAGRVLAPRDSVDLFRWSCDGIYLVACCDLWACELSVEGDNRTRLSCGGVGPTIAAALADAHARYQAALPDTLLRMSGLLREVVS